MKYILYIDYSASYKPMTAEYIALNAKTIAEAIIEADAIHDQKTMYLIKIMEKRGKIEKVESDVKAQTYTEIMEKRSTKWAAAETSHSAKISWLSSAIGLKSHKQASRWAAAKPPGKENDNAKHNRIDN